MRFENIENQTIIEIAEWGIEITVTVIGVHWMVWKPNNSGFINCDQYENNRFVAGCKAFACLINNIVRQ